MATVESLEIRMATLERRFNDIVNNSKDLRGLPKSTGFTSDTLVCIQNPGEGLTGIERADFISAVLGQLRRIDDDPAKNEVTAIGELVVGFKTGIFGGVPFIGIVSFFPPTQDSHINDIYIFNTF